jgi:GDPmannose 4,6-dehydratase
MATQLFPLTPGGAGAVPKNRVAFVTGVTGQDGSYLVELLLSLGYEVHGIKRRASSYNHPRLEHILDSKYPNGDNFYLHYGDVLDFAGLVTLLSKIKPHEVYNLAAQSHVKVSFEMPQYTGDVDGMVRYVVP